MRPPTFDRSLALACQVRTLRGYYLDVSCGCGARRVIALNVMASDRRFATDTLAHVAMELPCRGCHTGPDEVYLCATVHGRVPPSLGGGDTVWTLALVERPRGSSYHLRYETVVERGLRPS